MFSSLIKKKHFFENDTGTVRLYPNLGAAPIRLIQHALICEVI